MSYYFTFNFPQDLEPCSVNDMLRKLLLPRKWRHFLRVEQKVLVNQHYRFFNQLVYPGDKVELELSHVETLQGYYPASGKRPDVIYEDDRFLVINKPAGQKTHPNLNETNTALNDCSTFLKKSPFIVHRLDMLTSGLLLVAKSPAVVPILNRELTNKTFQREYLALVDHGENLAQQGTIALPLARDPNDQRKRMVQKDGLKAITHYQVLQQNSDQTALVRLILETGRTHQIRVHLAAQGCPIVGDPLYNPLAKNNDLLHLTAYQMSLVKPLTFDQLKIRLPIKKVPWLKK